MKVANEGSMLVAQALEKTKMYHHETCEQYGMYNTQLLDIIKLLEQALEVLSSDL